MYSKLWNFKYESSSKWDIYFEVIYFSSKENDFLVNWYEDIDDVIDLMKSEDIVVQKVVLVRNKNDLQDTEEYSINEVVDKLKH